MEDKARKELDRANRARAIYEDPLFAEAIEAIKDQLWKDFAQSKIGDHDTRLYARIGVDMLDKVCGALRKHMDTGKMAEKTLAGIEKRRDFFRKRA